MRVGCVLSDLERDSKEQRSGTGHFRKQNSKVNGCLNTISLGEGGIKQRESCHWKKQLSCVFSERTAFVTLWWHSAIVLIFVQTFLWTLVFVLFIITDSPSVRKAQQLL